MNSKINDLMSYLNEYKDLLNEEPIGSAREIDTIKIENMFSYIINDIDLDSISSANRQGKKIRGEKESIPQKIKRTIKNF